MYKKQVAEGVVTWEELAELGLAIDRRRTSKWEGSIAERALAVARRLRDERIRENQT